MNRSDVMRRVKARDTKPERIVRRLLRAAGHPGYRLDRRDLPGRPDIAFIGRRRAIFVHGCFWHGHDCARGARVPKTNAGYWLDKIGRNRARDVVALSDLEALGWESLVIWECELRDHAVITRRLEDFLAPAG